MVCRNDLRPSSSSIPCHRTAREQKRVRRSTALETMNIYRFYPRGNASQVKRTRKNRRYFQSSLIFQRMDKQHAFLVKNSTRIPKRVSEDSHLFPSPGSLARSTPLHSTPPRLFLGVERVVGNNRLTTVRSVEGKRGRQGPFPCCVYTKKRRALSRAGESGREEGRARTI